MSYLTREQKTHQLLRLDTSTPSLNDRIEERLSTNDFTSPVWKDDLRTSEAVVYIPRMSNRFIPSYYMKSQQIEVIYDKEDEVYISPSFLNRLNVPFYPFLSASKWFTLEHFKSFLESLGVTSRTANGYKSRLAGLKRYNAQSHVVGSDYVNSKRWPFLREIILKGMDEENLNQGGLRANSRPLLKRAA